MGLYELWQTVKGTHYPKAGVDPAGGTGGRTDFGDHPASFDCSGFVAWAFYKASNGAIKLPAYTDSLPNSPLVHRISQASVQPGDLVLYKFSDPGQPGVEYPHVAIYAGGGSVLQSGGNASFVNTAPVNQLPGATYWHVDGAPLYSSATGAPSVPMPTPDNPNPAPVITPPAPSNDPPASSGGDANNCGCAEIDLGAGVKIPDIGCSIACAVSKVIESWKKRWTDWWDTWTGAHAANLGFIVVGFVLLIVGLGVLIQSSGMGLPTPKAAPPAPPAEATA